MPLRQEMADKFQSGELRWVAATVGAFSTGIDLFSGQDTVINDLPWKPSSEDQLRSRTRRNGQKGVCRYHYIYGTAQDKKIRDKINDKRITIKAVI
jgi:SNF2 family DNA or RNA helicase